MYRWVTGLLAGIMLSSCAPWIDIQNIDTGMTKSEVLQQMGNPTDISGSGSEEYLYYIPANRFWQRYYVHLVNGRVESYGLLGSQPASTQ
jgi:outer membrane protein assembly factor BamE (lipoprotein component of BamABCDE complex)